MEARENFHLDAALRSARGLRRRSQQRIRAIETILQERAAKRARREHIDATKLAEQRIHETREAFAQAVLELIDLQEQLNSGAAQTERFLHALVDAKAAQTRVDMTREGLAMTQDRLKLLQTQRLARLENDGIELISCSTLDSPVNLAERLRHGGIGALAVLLILGLGQWLLVRRG